MALIVMAAVWKQLSHNFLFFLAGLQSIPKSLIEAAAIDGARPRRRFWTIQFPLLSPTTFFLLVINVVYAFFDTFAIVDAATQGGPGKDTAIPSTRSTTTAFKAMDLGGSAAPVGGADGDRRRAHGGAVPLRREEGHYRGRPWFERRPLLTLLTHLVLVLGSSSSRCRWYITFVASTHANEDIIHPPMSLLPGSHGPRPTRRCSPAPARGRAPRRRWGG